MWDELKEVKHTDKLRRSDVIELLFYGQTFSLSSLNSELKWVKDSAKTDYRYKNSKPNIENKKWVEKADEMRTCLMKHQVTLAENNEFGGYVFNWKDLYRTDIVSQIMAPVVYNVLNINPTTRNLIFRHGFVQAVPLAMYTKVYMSSNILILRTFNAAKSELERDGEFWKLKGGGSVENLKKLAFNNILIPSFLNIPSGLVSMESFVTYGMHLASTRFKEMPVFKRKDIPLDQLQKAENAVCQAVNTVHKLTSVAMGLEGIKSDYDMNTLQIDAFGLRAITRMIYCMKHSLVNIIMPSSRGFTQKYSAVSVNTGDNAMKPLLTSF